MAPYVDNGQRSHDIMHCQHCGWQQVLPPDTRGKHGNNNHQYEGRKCPFCGSTRVRYEKEDNR